MTTDPLRPDPTTIVFDVNETLTDMSPLGERFVDVGADRGLAAIWFAALLRDAFALAAAGGTAPFARFADGALRTVLHGLALDRPLDAAVRHVLDALPDLYLHPDVVEGVVRLHEQGRRLVTLTNGAAGNTERLLDRSGLRDRFEAVLSVEDAGVWKPAAGAYAYAARACGRPPSELALVAVHAWDIEGAQRAGLAGAWVNRDNGPYPSYFARPTWEIRTIGGLADALRA